MQKATLRMQRFIHDLLEFSEFSSTPPQWNLVNLNEVVSGVIFDLENRIEKSQGTVEVGDLPSIETDRLQMRQLFQNMISNALKFRKPGIPPHVTVKSRPAGPGQWEIIIQDNGIGFNMQYFDRILKPFQRLHGRRAYEGRGLGLAVCQKVVENHGGEITAESSPGNGACFTVLLPEKQQLNG
jgi:light-regulated signal transduction histidine kinase (bacteriophytochrome)